MAAAAVPLAVAGAQVAGNMIGGKQAQAAKDKATGKVDQASGPMLDFANQLRQNGGITNNPYEGAQWGSLQNMQNNPYVGNMQSLAGQMVNPAYASQLEGIASSLSNGSNTMEGAADYAAQKAARFLGGQGGSIGSGQVGSAVSDIYAGLARDTQTDRLNRAQLQSGIYNGLESGNLARQQASYGAYSGLGQDQYNRNQGVFSGLSGMNQTDYLRRMGSAQLISQLLGNYAGLYASGMNGNNFTPNWNFSGIMPFLPRDWGGGGGGVPATPAPAPTPATK